MIYGVLGFILGCVQAYYWYAVAPTPPGVIRWFLILLSPIIYGLAAMQIHRFVVRRRGKRN